MAQRGRGSGRGLVSHVRLDPSLRSSLVHLPQALHAPLVERNVPPQAIVVELTALTSDHGLPATYYCGWSGQAAAVLTPAEGAVASAAASAAAAAASSSATSSLSTSLDTTLAMSPVLASAFTPSLLPPPPAPWEAPATMASTQVRITLLRSPPLPIAARVNVTPVGPDDWELLSTYAQEVELNLLAQCRSACAGMTLVVFVGKGNRSVCKFTVDSTDPPTQSVLSPIDKNDKSARAVRLSNDTELVIAPKQRAPVRSPTEPVATTLPPTAAGSSSAGAAQAAQARSYLARTLYRVVPAHVGLRVESDSEVLPPPTWVDHAVLVDSNTLATLQAAAPTSAPRATVTRVSCPTGSATRVIGSPVPGVEEGPLGPASSPRPNRSSAPAVVAPAPEPTSSSDSLSLALPTQHVYVGSALRAALHVQDYDLVLLAPSQGDKQLALPTPLPTKSGLTLPPSPATPRLAGADEILDRAAHVVENHFWSRRLFDAGVSGQLAPARSSAFPPALLLTGGPGSGKTSVATEVAKRMAFLPSRQGLGTVAIATHYVDCAVHAEDRTPALRTHIAGWLASAAWTSPSILILDNVDRLAPAEQEHADGSRPRQLAEMVVKLTKEAGRDHPVFVLCTAQNNTAIHPVLSAGHLFVDTLHLRAPNKLARQQLLRLLVQRRTQAGSGVSVDQLDFVTLAGQAEGYMAADLRDWVDRAVAASAIRVTATTETDAEENLRLTMADLAKAQEGFVPQSLRDVSLQEGGVSWAEIGGLHDTRRVLRETLEWPVKYGPIFASCPLRLRSGLLLYGYPGCGKTMLASAVAKECGLHFIGVKGPEILNKYIGASEKSVRDLFERAQAAKPCVLFFDEFDAIAPRRGHDSTGVTDRVVNQLLTQMDGAEGLDGVYVLAATSRPDLIDAALLRPGRLDKSLLCDMPSTQDRADILSAVSHKIPLDASVNLEYWAERTKGFSGADLQALVYNAHLIMVHQGLDEVTNDDHLEDRTKDSNDPTSLNFVRTSDEKLSGAQRTALQRHLALILSNTLGPAQGTTQPSWPPSLPSDTKDTKAKGSKDTKRTVTDAHLQQALKETRPSVPPDEQARLHRIYASFAGDRDGAFPDGQAPDTVGARETLM